MSISFRKFFEDFMAPRDEVSDETDSHDVQFATAALLMEVSRSSEDISSVEKEAILEILNRLFDFSKYELRKLMELAESAAHDAHDLYSFTKLINDEYEYPAKKQLVKNLWKVAYADGRLDEFEEHIVRKISGLIHVSHHDFVRAKIMAREGMPD